MASVSKKREALLLIAHEVVKRSGWSSGGWADWSVSNVEAIKQGLLVLADAAETVAETEDEASRRVPLIARLQYVLEREAKHAREYASWYVTPVLSAASLQPRRYEHRGNITAFLTGAGHTASSIESIFDRLPAEAFEYT